MPQIIEFEGQRHEFPDDFSQAEIATALGSLPRGAPAAQVSAVPEGPPMAPAQNGPLGFRNPLRQLQTSVQGAGRGIADLAGMGPDLVNAPLNLLLAGADKVSGALGGPDISFRFPSASESIANTAASAAKAIGVPVVDEADMSPQERLGYNVNRIGSQAAGGVAALARHGVRRGAEIALGSKPRMGDALARPYMGENIGRTVVGDAAGALGAGSAISGVQEAAKAGVPGADTPIAEVLAALAGGVGGLTGAVGAEKLARGGAKLAGMPFGLNIDKSIDVDPLTGQPATRKASDAAATILRNEAVEPDAARARISDNRAELRAGGMETTPTPAALSEDPGLQILSARIDREPANQGRAVARNQKFNTAVRDQLDRVTPADATSAPLIARAEQEAAALTGQAQGRVDTTQRRAGTVADARRQDAATLEGFQGRGVAASQDIDETFRTTRSAEQARSRGLYRDPALTQAEVPVDPMVDTATTIGGRGTRAAPLDPVVQKYVDRFRLQEMDEEGNVVRAGFEEGQQVSMREINAVRAELEGDIKNNLHNGEVVRHLRALKDATAGYVDELADSGNDAARAATENFATRVQPNFREGAGGRMDRRMRADSNEVNLAPSDTARNFLTRPEDAADLMRIAELGGRGPETAQSARTWVLDQLSRTGVSRDGAIDPVKLGRWRNINRDMIDQVPGLRAEVDRMQASAQRGERLAGQAEGQVERAQENLRATQDRVNKGALGSVMNSDPDKSVAAIMSSPNNAGRRMQELIDLTANDAEARAGLKAAVRDFMVDKATTTAAEKLVPGDRRGPVSQAKLTNLLRQHERELALIFSPEEMNALRTGHRALELAGIDRVAVGTGSNTAEKQAFLDRMLQTPLGKGIEAYSRLRYGVLKTGGLIATARRMTSGLDSGAADEVHRLVQRAAGDPELMMLLLGRKIPVGSPAWNGKLNRLLGLAEGAREVNSDE